MPEAGTTKTLKSNAKFANEELIQICQDHSLDLRWATQRQASKYRNKKGRVWNNVRHKVKG